MDVPITTLNTADAVANSSIAADKPAFNPNSTGLVNTVTDATDRSNAIRRMDGTITDDVDTSDKTLKQESEVTEDKGKTTEPDATKDADDTGDDTRFDKHPRWQELKRERDEARRMADEARIRLETERDVLRRQAEEAAKVEKPKELPFKDITALDDDEIAEWQARDPKGYAANLYRQVLYEADQKLNARQADIERQTQAKSQEAKIKATYDAYERDNPDFRTSWDSGQIQKFMDENPGHNPISAHMVMTADKRIKSAAEKAAKEAEERTNKNWQAKRQAKVIGSGPATIPGAGEDSELQNTKEKGGAITVLADRLRRMRTG